MKYVGKNEEGLQDVCGHDRKLGQNNVVWNENEELIVSYSATKFKIQSNLCEYEKCE